MPAYLLSSFDPWSEPVLVALGVYFAALVWLASVKLRVQRRDAKLRMENARQFDSPDFDA